MIIRPLYLDEDLLAAIGDSTGVAVHSQSQVEKREGRSRVGSAGLDAGLKLGGERSREEETSESFTRHVPAASRIATVLEGLQKRDPPLAPNHFADLKRREVYEFEASIGVHPANVLAEVVGPTFRYLMENPSGLDVAAGPNLEFMRNLASERMPETNLITLGVGFGGALIAAIRRNYMLVDGLERLEDDLFVLGVVDRLVPDGASRDLVPLIGTGVSRIVRKQISNTQLVDLLRDFEPTASESDLELRGPGAVISVAAIYS